MAADVYGQFFTTILKNDRPTHAYFSWRAIQQYNEADDATRKCRHQLRIAGFETKGEDDANMRTSRQRSFCSMCVNRRKRGYESIFDWYIFYVINKLFKQKGNNSRIKFFQFFTLRFPLEVRKSSFYFR